MVMTDPKPDIIVMEPEVERGLVIVSASSAQADAVCQRHIGGIKEIYLVALPDAPDHSLTSIHQKKLSRAKSIIDLATAIIELSAKVFDSSKSDIPKISKHRNRKHQRPIKSRSRRKMQKLSRKKNR
jgi:hypothetical protein